MKDKKEMLLSYIKANVAPILVDFIDGKDFPGAIVIPADVDAKELNGHYESTEFNPPEWLKKLEPTSAPTILVIDKIDSIPKDEQLKFVEILKYRQVSTFELPKNTVIVVTANEINKDKINEEILSLVARI